MEVSKLATFECAFTVCSIVSVRCASAVSVKITKQVFKFS